MAAAKHSLAEAEDAVRPSKKTKTQNGAADEESEKARLKREKREKKEKKQKKKEAKRKLEEGLAASNGGKEDAADLETEEKERKKARKQEKKEKKLKQAAQQNKDEDVEISEAPPAEEEKEKKKSKKDKKDKKRSKNGDASSNPDATKSNGAVLSDYVQTMSLSNVPQSEIDSFLSAHHITITDPRSKTVVLRPVIEFSHLPATNLLEKKPSPFAGFKAPTPIQAASWPFTLSGRDAVGVAETGSGKTMAFALPCVESMSAMRGKKGVKAVIVSPTRELAMQTHTQLSSLAALIGLKCVCLYGGASKDEQRALLGRGVDIIVATPGRLKDFMSDGTVDLGGSKFVVLDEADRMLDKGFEDDIKGILGACPPREQRQTLMFTATWPTSVQSLAATFMVDPIKITIGSQGRETADGSVELQANARITQRVEVLDPRDKEARLLTLVKQYSQGKAKNDRILVFCLYKKEATRIENFLSRKGINVGGIHGDLRQEQRTRSLEAFKQGTTPVLVATDVAARGLDIPEVKLVINVTVSVWWCGSCGISISNSKIAVPPDYRGLRPPHRPYWSRRQNG
jgi:ATP-dependent RNA helicase DBP3